MSAPSVGRSALGMGAATAASRALGFVRVLVVAAVLGATYLGNTFLAANSVSNVLFELLAAGALSAVLVPTFVDLLDRDDRAEAERLAGGVLGYALLGLGAVTLLGVLGAGVIARILSSGADDPAIAADQRALARYLLVFFVPQLLLYAFGAVATAGLYARRRFAVTAAAPIANSVVTIGAMVAFAAVVGSDPGLDLTTGERLLLVLAGTGGVAAFVGVLVAAAARAGFRLRPRLPRHDAALRRLFGLSAWAVLAQAGVGVLLAGSLVLGNAVEGGVVAYQVAFVFFLAPYAILAQPLNTAVLPELAVDARRGDAAAFAGSVRWALDAMAVLVLPVSVAMVVFAQPFMDVVVFGEAAGGGAELVAAALAALAVGLVPYSAVFLFSRGYYAFDDSRTPAFAAIASSFAGVAVMAIGVSVADGAARVAALGLGHSAAQLVAASVLGYGLARRVGAGFWPRHLLIAGGLSLGLGLAGWWGLRVVDPAGRPETFAALAVVGTALGALYVGGLRVFAGPLRPLLRYTA